MPTTTSPVTTAVTTAKADLTKVESTVKTDIATIETDVKTDLAKTYTGKVVALAFAAGLVVGPIALAILRAIL